MFIDFGALPPEINATRLYTGPGAAPMLAAATAWHQVAAELSSAAANYQLEVTGLDQTWKGLTGQRMAAAAAPYIQWLTTTAAQAEQAGVQATAQAVAYESARAAMTPPPVIAANRSLQMSLISSNFLGLNTAAITATEALYMEMWAQCVAAMNGYAAATEQSSALTTYVPPRPNTNLSALPAQLSALGQPAGSGAATNAAATASASGTSISHQLSTGVSDILQPSYYTAGAINNSSAFFRALAPAANAVSSPGLTGANALMLAPSPLASSLSGVPGSAPIAANLASATRIGGMSVPTSWATAAPAAPAAATMPATNLASGIGGPNAAGNMLGGVPLSGTGAGAGARGVGDGVVRTGPRAFVMPRPLPAG